MKKFMAGVLLTIILGIIFLALSSGGSNPVSSGNGGTAGMNGGNSEVEVWTVYGWDDLWSDMTQEEKDMCVNERANVLQMETPQRERCAAYLAGFDEGMK